MRKPYYIVTAECTNERCQEAVFSVERKHIVKTATSGQQYQIDRIVCSKCRQWQPIIKIEKVA